MLYGPAISQSDCRKTGPYQLQYNKTSNNKLLLFLIISECKGCGKSNMKNCPTTLLRVMAIKKSTLDGQFFQRPLNCRVVCGTPFKKNIWVPIFSKNLPDTGSMYHTFFPLRSPTFCHILRVPGGVRHPSFVFIRQRVQAPGRSRIDHPTFTSGHRLVPYLQI